MRETLSGVARDPSTALRSAQDDGVGERVSSGGGATYAIAGGAVWMLVAGLTAAGWLEVTLIEVLFLVAPLVTVPLGLGLVRQECVRLLKVQPVFGALCAGAILTPAGSVASVTLAGGWFICCLLVTGVGVRMLRRAESFVAGAGLVYLIVGGGALVVARLDVMVIGYSNPLIFLAAVHFHFAGFALQILAAEALKQLRLEKLWERHVLAAAAVGVVLMPAVVLTGFLLHAVALRSAAAIVLTAAVSALAVIQLVRLRSLSSVTARMLLGVGSTAVMVAMVLGAVYAAGDWLGTVWISIPMMAQTHGVLNVVFVMASLSAWTLARNSGLGRRTQ